MTEPQSGSAPATERVPSLADVAKEPPEESVRHERDAVGDDPDLGRVVPTDDAQ